MSKKPQLRCFGSLAETFEPLKPESAYRNFLHNTCKAAKVPEADSAKVLEVFDRLAPSGPQMAFQVTLASVGVTEPTIKKTVATIQSAILESLEKANREHKIAAKSALERYREAVQKAKSQEGRELEVDIGGKLRLGVFETREELNKAGMLERKAVYRAIASEKHPGLEIEVI